MNEVIGQKLLHNNGIILVLELLHFAGNISRLITIFEGAGFLKNNIPLVVVFVDPMNRNARLLFGGCLYRRMHMHTVHPFTAISRQESRMNIDHPAGEGFYQIRRHQPKEACQHNKADVAVLQLCEQVFATIKGRTLQQQGIYVALARHLQHGCISFIRDNERYFDPGVIVEVVNKNTSVASCTGGKDGKPVFV